MGRMQTRALVESAILAAVTALLGIIYYYSQYLGIIALIWPVPVIIVGYRNGLKASILSALSAALIVSLITHPLVGLGLLAGFGLPGVLMGYMMKKRYSPYLIIFLCGIVLAFTSLAELVLSLKAAGLDITTVLQNTQSSFMEQMEATAKMARQMGLPEENIKIMEGYSESFIEMAKMMLPSMIFFGGIFSSFVDFKFARLILRRIGYEVSDIEKFMYWRIPEPYSLALLITAIAAAAVSYFKIPGWETLAANIFIIILYTFTILGISIIVYFTKVYGNKYGVPKAVRIIIIAAAILFFSQFIPLLGLVDITFNLRRLGPNSGGVR